MDLVNVFVNPDFLELKTTLQSEKKELMIIHGAMDTEVFTKKKVRDYRESGDG